MKRTGPIKVLIVDDSPLVRTTLSRVLAQAADIEVVGGAKDVLEARQLILAYRPDMIILDLEMPQVDGLSFLKKLQIHHPVPVIMCSDESPANGRAALDAIECGAVDVLVKPSVGGAQALRSFGEDLTDKVRAAALAMKVPPPASGSAKSAPISFRSAGLDPYRYVVAIGASTGGTEAIKVLLSQVPDDFPGVVIVEHMPEGFTRAFAGRLDQFSALSVREAGDGDELAPGKGFVARGGVQMTVQIVAGKRTIRYGSRELVNRHCPSVGVLFNSVAECVGRNAVGIIMTGMGADGAEELLNMRRAGAITVAQDKRSCVVHGMPKAAEQNGAAMFTAAPVEIPHLVIRELKKRELRRARTPVG